MGMKKEAVLGKIERDLTEREIAVGRLVCQGLRNEQIGDRLKIATKTVEAHRANLYKKVKVNNTAQLVAVSGKTSMSLTMKSASVPVVLTCSTGETGPVRVTSSVRMSVW